MENEKIDLLGCLFCTIFFGVLVWCSLYTFGFLEDHKITGLGCIELGAKTSKVNYDTMHKTLPLGFQSFGVMATVKSSKIYSVYYRGESGEGLSVDKVVRRLDEKYAKCNRQSHALYKCPADEGLLVSLVPEIAGRTSASEAEQKKSHLYYEPYEKSFRWYEVFRGNDRNRHIGVFVLVVQRRKEGTGHSSFSWDNEEYEPALSEVILVAWDEALIAQSQREQKEREIDGI